ncbi:MAG: ABC transporter ATP-binding protein [Fuerstiella sp.]|nr:ABC transporter ATP-binding protein [Fuerstiella sp.]
MSLLLQSVRKNYQEPDGTPLPVLAIEEYELVQGEQAALIGSSGCGKTTLLNVISGILTPDSGQVTVSGTDITQLPEVVRDRFRAERIGFVFQTFNLLPGFTALENVLLGMTFSRNRSDRAFAKSLLERVGLKDRQDHRPGRLSVGEQQRVSVARSLANRPALLLADEPTANVDPANQDMILSLIRETCSENKVTLLMVTHAAEVAQKFDRVDRLQDFNRPEPASREVVL